MKQTGKAISKGKERTKVPDKTGEQKLVLKKIPHATHQGNLRNIFGFDVECFVLDDSFKTAVISVSGFARALNLPAGSLENFKTQGVRGVIGRDLSKKLRHPIQFRWSKDGKELELFQGYDATVLLDFCRAIRMTISLSEPSAARAEAILAASAKTGTRNLVYALAKHSPTAQEVIVAFQSYLREEIQSFGEEFPTELYAAWGRLYDLTPIPGVTREVEEIILADIYQPLARIHGKVLAIEGACKDTREREIQVLLKEVGPRALWSHLGKVLEIAESSPNREIYEARIKERFKGRDTPIEQPALTEKKKTRFNQVKAQALDSLDALSVDEGAAEASQVLLGIPIVHS